MAGKPVAFILASIFVILWFLGGLIGGFTTSWLLIINTNATINASLMVFIIQNTQCRESKALHMKVDGLIKSIREAERELIAIEKLEESDLEFLRKKLFDS